MRHLEQTVADSRVRHEGNPLSLQSAEEMLFCSPEPRDSGDCSQVITSSGREFLNSDSMCYLEGAQDTVQLRLDYSTLRPIAPLLTGDGALKAAPWVQFPLCFG